MLASLMMIGALWAVDDSACVRGTVTERVTGSPLQGAVVRLRPGVRGTSTGERGEFIIGGIRPGTYTLDVTLLGHRPLHVGRVTLAGGDSLSFDLALDEAPIEASQVVVTAGRREQSLSDIPVSLATVDADALAGRATLQLDEALRNVPGVNVVEDQINIRGSSGYSRGVGSRVLLLLDGIPFLTGDTGEINWETLPIDQVERVEVLKGAGSALYGSSALGGVINVITRPAGGETWFRSHAFGGIYQEPAHPEWRWAERPRFVSGLTFSGGTTVGGVGMTVSASRWMDESYRQNDVTHRYSVYGKAQIPIGQDDGLQLTVHEVHRTSGTFFWWKSLREPLRPPDDLQDRWVDTDRGHLALVYRKIVSDRSLMVIRGQWFANDWTDRTGPAVNSHSRSDRVAVETQWTIDPGASHQVVAGATAYRDRVRSDIFGSHPGVGAAVYAQEDFTPIEQLTLTAGARLDWQQVASLPDAVQFDPKAGVAWHASSSTTIRASAGTGFRYPSIGELYTSVTTGFGSVNVVPNVHLRPERAFSAELGVRQTVAAHGWVDAAAFWAQYRDLIEAGVDPDKLQIKFDNVDRARIVGAELNAGAEWCDRAITTSMSLTAMEPRDLVEHRVLKFRPRLMATAMVEWHSGGQSAAVEYRHVGRLAAIDENLVALANIVDGQRRGPIHVVDLRAGSLLQLAAVPLRLSVQVRNVLNYQYVELIGNLAPPRTYLLAVDLLL